MRYLGLLFAIMLLFGCAKGMKVDKISAPPTQVDSVVLLNENSLNRLLRRALIKQGFKVPARASVENVKEKSQSLDVSYNKAEARYGIRHGGELSGNNPCITNGDAKHFSNYELELIDLQTNETLLFVSKGGWTEYCTGGITFNTTTLLEDLVAELKSALQ